MSSKNPKSSTADGAPLRGPPRTRQGSQSSRGPSSAQRAESESVDVEVEDFAAESATMFLAKESDLHKAAFGRAGTALANQEVDAGFLELATEEVDAVSVAHDGFYSGAVVPERPSMDDDSERRSEKLRALHRTKGLVTESKAPLEPWHEAWVDEVQLPPSETDTAFLFRSPRSGTGPISAIHADAKTTRSPISVAGSALEVSEPAFAFDQHRADELFKLREYAALFSHYMNGAECTNKWDAKPVLYRHAARIAEEHLEEPERAFLAWYGVVVCLPEDVEPQLELERIARGLGTLTLRRWKDAVRTLKVISEATSDPQARAAYLALLARWHMFELKRQDTAAEYLNLLSKIDPVHPLLLERRANESRATGDAVGQKKHLTRALERALRPDDRQRFQLALAELHEGPLDQKKTAEQYYADVLRDNPDLLAAVQGMARLARARGDLSQVLQSLERELPLAKTLKHEHELRLKLAAEHEVHGDAQRAVELVLPLTELAHLRVKAWHIVEKARARLGDDRGVAEAMVGRGLAAPSLKTKTELLMAAAELLETQIIDVDGAIEVLRQVVACDDRHQGALTALRRLSTTLGRDTDAVAWGVRLSERMRDKAKAAQLANELGRELLHLGDREGAKAQFMRAQGFDRRNAEAFMELESLAREDGDLGAADALAYKRAQSTETGAHAASMFLQVARERADHNNAEGSLAALLEGYKRDHQNADIVAMLLFRYLQAKRFQDAYPLCELAIELAERSNRISDTRALRRRLTEILTALGLQDKALAAATIAFQASTADPETREDLLRVAASVGPEAAASVSAHLCRIAEHARTMNGALLLVLAAALLNAGEFSRAREVVLRLLHQAADDADGLHLLEKVALAEHNWREVADIKMHLARVLESAGARYEKMVQAGDIYARRLADLPSAIVAFEAAGRINRADPWLRDTLRWAYQEVSDWVKLAEMLREDARAQSGAARVLILRELAELAEHKLQDSEVLAAALDEILDTDRDALDAFEKLVKLRFDVRDYPKLEQAYLKMIERIADGSRVPLAKELNKQLGLLYRDKLGDLERARRALAKAYLLDPQDLELLKMSRELCLLLGREEEVLILTRALIKREPLDESLYLAIYDLQLGRRAFDKAWNAVDVAAQLAPLDDELAQYHADYPPYETSAVPGTMTEDAWYSHLLHPELDPQLTTLIGHLASAAMGELLPESLTPEAFSEQHSPMAPWLHSAIVNGAEVFGFSSPPLFVGAGSDVLTQRLAPTGLSVVPGLLEQAGDALLFHVGLALSSLRPELRPASYFPSVKELSSLLARGIQRDPKLFSRMAAEAQADVVAILEDARARGTVFDLKKWLFFAHASSARAAFVLCGSAHCAAFYYSSLHDDPQALEKLGELYAFAVGDECAELRAAIGVAVGAEAPV